MHWFDLAACAVAALRAHTPARRHLTAFSLPQRSFVGRLNPQQYQRLQLQYSDAPESADNREQSRHPRRGQNRA
jgi:hypothetical protein